MRPRATRLVTALLGLGLAASPAFAQRRAAVPDGIQVEVLSAPAVARVGGVDQLTYELHVTNLARRAVSLAALEVFDADDGAPIASFVGAAMPPLLKRPGLGPRDQHRATIDPGLRAVIYLDLPLRSRAAPRRVRHRIAFDLPPDTSARDAARSGFAVDAGPVAVDRGRGPVLGPPLRGGPWAAVFDPGVDRGHRRVLYPVGGRVRLPGRFAIDWFRVDDRGRTAARAPDRPGDFFGYGADVLAVADGVVAATVDGVAEPERLGESRPGGSGGEAGNLVVLDLGHGRYAFYEHLRPGLRVRPGERVRKGQVIATLGFTGQASVAHLHFHVADAPSPFDADGRAYTFERYEVLGGYPALPSFDGGEAWAPARPAAHEARSLPRPNAVVRFPDR